MTTPKEYRIYVIRLDERVLASKKFSRENPNRNPTKPCVYVGSTFHSPEKRYEQHLTTKLGNSFVRLWHQGLHKQMTAKQPVFLTREEAKAHEAALAERLRRRGFGVWSR
ncbi:MAG: hypothetical protein ING66_07375 [Rhodocyclaceae bacterium]|nr:hypothetical protein [Rhodocyclaceae bacterium]MCA3021454.1 hypothetical protein [Rhodocyclaceae bacterium]MCA3028404.1 hypothetical protein [Rhodocyclaceae bacterium]MCA3044007.1 hypothetical protein [Rhodocyclaceae bacterium]MCA3054202.1 hypothetical protein [Rhodocyclaceae bacterium]